MSNFVNYDNMYDILSAISSKYGPVDIVPVYPSALTTSLKDLLYTSGILLDHSVIGVYLPKIERTISGYMHVGGSKSNYELNSLKLKLVSKDSADPPRVDYDGYAVSFDIGYDPQNDHSVKMTVEDVLLSRVSIGDETTGSENLYIINTPKMYLDATKVRVNLVSNENTVCTEDILLTDGESSGYPNRANHIFDLAPFRMASKTGAAPDNIITFMQYSYRYGVLMATTYGISAGIGVRDNTNMLSKIMPAFLYDFNISYGSYAGDYIYEVLHAGVGQYGAYGGSDINIQPHLDNGGLVRRDSTAIPIAYKIVKKS